jgi:hypothetical protein
LNARNFDYIETLGYAQLRLRAEKDPRSLFKGDWIVKEAFAMQRYGSVIGVKPEVIAEYRKHQGAVWPDVLEMIRKCHIRNYSIFLRDDSLLGYWGYHGADFQADMAKNGS